MMWTETVHIVIIVSESLIKNYMKSQSFALVNWMQVKHVSCILAKMSMVNSSVELSSYRDQHFKVCGTVGTDGFNHILK